MKNNALNSTQDKARRGPFRIGRTEQVYQNPWITVREDHVTHENGSPGLFGVVTMKPGSTVLAIDDEQHVHLVREFKYAYGRESIELVSGGIDPGETPLAAAQRELLEELGVLAASWQDMGVLNPFTVTIDSPNYMFLATGLRPGTPRPDDFEQIEPLRVPLAVAQHMAESGEITHAASVVLLLKTKIYGTLVL